MTTLYLIRHCETTGNRSHTFQGRNDTPPTETGLRQLDALAERFKDVPLDAIYTSPLPRTLRTAQAVNLHHGLPVVTDERLIEVSGGKFDGEIWENLMKIYPGHIRRWIEEPWNFEAPDGEAMRDVYTRMKDAICDIARKNPGKHVAVVSHGGALKTAMCILRGLPIEQMKDHAFVCKNTAVTTAETEDGETFRVIMTGDVSHLPERLITPRDE